MLIRVLGKDYLDYLECLAVVAASRLQMDDHAAARAAATETWDGVLRTGGDPEMLRVI